MNSSQYDKSLLKRCGEDVFISNMVEIRRPYLVEIGCHVAIDSGVYITTQLVVGDYIHMSPYITVIGGEKSKLVIQNFATIAAGTRIIAGSDSFLGDGMTSVTVPAEYRDTVKFSAVVIEQFAGVGTNVVIMPGVTIGEGSVIGACSLVTKDTEPWTIYYGNPARPIKIRNKAKMIEYANKLGYNINGN